MCKKHRMLSLHRDHAQVSSATQVQRRARSNAIVYRSNNQCGCKIASSCNIYNSCPATHNRRLPQIMAASLSQSKCSCLVKRSHKGTQRLVIRPVPFSSSTSRSRNVQVYAKGKGRRMSAPMPQQGQMVKPQAPEVDLENEEFCIFTRATTGNYQNWIFVSVVKGGSAANAMVKSLESPWGRKLYGRTLISNIGSAVYKDRDAIVKSLKNQIKNSMQQSAQAPMTRIMEPVLNQPVTAFQFAFKIRDKSRAMDFSKAENLTILPKESDIAVLPLDNFKKFFSPENLSTLFTGGSS